MEISTQQEIVENEPSLTYIKRIDTNKKGGATDTDQYPQLVLYFHMDCPFCLRVLNYLDRLNKAVNLKNVKEDHEAKDYLLEMGGKTQVPCLMIDGKAVYESLDIIRWISENKEKIPDLS